MPSTMQYDVAKLLLHHIGDYGFALSGGYALYALDLTDRPTEDVDLFTSSLDVSLFGRAIDEAMAVLARAGYRANLTKKSDTFARINIDHDEQPLSIDLGYDYREYPTVALDIGPVLDKKDAILNKVSALYARMLPRDYIDVYSILNSGDMTKAEILVLSQERDEGFVREYFVDVLRRVRTLAYEDFAAYGISRDMYDAITTTMLAWADDIESTDPA